ncbi:MAG: cytochrome c oxidase assembly protein [Acidimicrobiales bacterium]
MAGTPAAAEPLVRPARSSSPAPFRAVALGGAGLAVLAIFLPPLWGAARHYVFAETIQFSLAAFVIPALVVVGRPVQWWGRRRGSTGSRGGLWGALERLGQSRLRHPELVRALAFLVVYLTLVVLWRTPDWVNAVGRHEWLVLPEMGSLVVAGVGAWVEIVVFPPLVPRLARPWRGLIAALAMWVTWIAAYVVGFSHVSWYHAYHHGAGGLSASGDQQIAAAIVWVVAAATFLPAVFSEMMAWLRSAEDPDAELRQLVRAERRSGWRHPWEPPPGR